MQQTGRGRFSSEGSRTGRRRSRFFQGCRSPRHGYAGMHGAPGV